MPLDLCDIATTSEEAIQYVPIAHIAQIRGIPRSKQRLLQRYFQLESVAQINTQQFNMLLDPLRKS